MMAFLASFLRLFLLALGSKRDVLSGNDSLLAANSAEAVLDL
jgi:hypothetical protein